METFPWLNANNGQLEVPLRFDTSSNFRCLRVRNLPARVPLVQSCDVSPREGPRDKRQQDACRMGESRYLVVAGVRVGLPVSHQCYM